MNNRGFLFNIILSPLFIFPMVWVVSLSTYIFAIDLSFIFNQNYQILVLIFFISNIIFISTYLSLRLNKNGHLLHGDNFYNIHLRQNKLKRIKRILTFLAMVIIFYNLYTSGLFPLFKIFNYDVFVYSEYGRFKGILIPLLNIIGLLGIFEKRKFANLISFIMVISIFILYILRGPLILFLCQYFIVNTMYKRNKIHFALKAFFFFLIFYGVIVFLGNIRTGNAMFMSFFNIKAQYHDMDMGLLWIIIYIAAPFSDLITTVQYQANYLFGISTINEILPAFIKFDPIEANTTLNFIDGPKTYLAPYFEDFGWMGIIGANYVIALICFILKNDSRFYKNFLIMGLLYSSVLFIFFTNYIFYFSTIVQFILSIIIFKNIKENQLEMKYEKN